MLSEYLGAVGLVSWCRRNDVLIFRVPNRSLGEKNWRKQVSEGASKGCPDYAFVLPDGTWLAWELKKTGGKRTPEQVKWGNDLLANNALYGYGTWREAIARLDSLSQSSR